MLLLGAYVLYAGVPYGYTSGFAVKYCNTVSNKITVLTKVVTYHFEN